jgi:hypothetical protein
MAISKRTKWEKIVTAIAIAITVKMAKRIYRKLRSPANYIFLALLSLFYSIFVLLLLMSFVAGRIRVIAETFPQFRIFTDSWLFVPFAIVSFGFIYIFLFLLLRWYFEKKSFVKFIDKVLTVVATGVKASATGAKKVVKKTAHGASTITKVTAKGAGKFVSVAKKIILTPIRKIVHQKPEQEKEIDSAEDTQKE